MNWTALIPIIAQYGIPLAEQLFQKWQANEKPTQADFDELNKMASQTARDRLEKQLTAANIPLDDPHAQALLSQVSSG